MKRQSKLNAREQEQLAAQQQAQQQVPTEFESPEAMLRHDALHTAVPPAVAQRLRDSISQLPAPPRSWWRRWFGS
jgi:hypothetical protein